MLILSERTWRAHEKERQVFLFDMGILLCRRQEMNLGKIKYVYKQKVMVWCLSVSLYVCMFVLLGIKCGINQSIVNFIGLVYIHIRNPVHICYNFK